MDRYSGNMEEVLVAGRGHWCASGVKRGEQAIRRLVGGQGSTPEDAASHVNGAAFDDVGAFGDYFANPVAYIARQVIGVERGVGLGV